MIAQALAARLEAEGESIGFLGLLNGYPRVEESTDEPLPQTRARLHAFIDDAGLHAYGGEVVDESLRERIVDVALNNERLMRLHRPITYSGPVLFARAARRVPDDSSPSVDAWRAYLAGGWK